MTADSSQSQVALKSFQPSVGEQEYIPVASSSCHPTPVHSFERIAFYLALSQLHCPLNVRTATLTEAVPEANAFLILTDLKYLGI